MKTSPTILLLGLGFIAASATTGAQENVNLPATAPSSSEFVTVIRTAEELDELLGPVALYPDALIALILPAAAAPTDVVLAARYLDESGDTAAIDGQPWDESVRALAHYPDVIEWMDTNLRWTIQIGEAFLAQPTDVMQSVQRLRAQARASGALTDTPQHKVLLDVGAIRIVPADPEVIYVPYYDPAVVYVERRVYRPNPIVTFGLGFTIGSWLRYDCDWQHRRIWVVNPSWHWHSHHNWRHDRFYFRFGHTDFHHHWHPWTPPPRRHWHNVHPDRDRHRDWNRDRDRDRPRRDVVLPAPFPGRPGPSNHRSNDRDSRLVDRSRDRDRDSNSERRPRSVVETPTHLVTDTPNIAAPRSDTPARPGRPSRSGDRGRDSNDDRPRENPSPRGQRDVPEPPRVVVNSPPPARASDPPLPAHISRSRNIRQTQGNISAGRATPAPARVRNAAPAPARVEAPRAAPPPATTTVRSAPPPRENNSSVSEPRARQANGDRKGRVYGGRD